MNLSSLLPFLPALRRFVLAAAAGLVLTACGGQVELLSQVSESQANEVLAALLKQGIAAQKIPGKEGMVSVNVPQSGVAQAIEIMQAQGLPREPHVRMGDVFKKEGLISSPLEERARLIFALSQELAGTISKIDGVIHAQVHVVLPERGNFGEAGNPSSAAVFIKHQDTVNLDGVLPQIRRLVANSIPGLSFDKVSVVLVPSAAQVEAAAPAQNLEAVWGLEVAPDSAAGLRVLLAGLVFALLAALAGAAFLFWQGRRARPGNADA
ncbi:type III secretion system inner membrane ring lipoprotein SctJ [Pseudothauera rhizosphaerae]|uniref:Lipoprotein n=1 Tax=Pseudothauera rhizosphaerae TaxID=2565932 RepID=A0A4S4AEV1_9RHOO|nr:type III secretion inner membrane ring lipoprotein SctJ [Pseudothauera rhizosphaerae]THF57271.1 EscJ/YscJ/HrcJ family type III secretion inner membrane ring protein [Pseudothauera rhizosphaerae]